MNQQVSDPRVGLAQDRTGMAKFRTELALDRTTLASQRRCALPRHGIHPGNKLGSMVEGGAPGKQAIVPRENRGWLGLHRHTEYLSRSQCPTRGD